MKVEILHDTDGGYGYPKNTIIDAEQLVDDYINCLNKVEDADTIFYLLSLRTEYAVDFVAEMWQLDYELLTS